MYLPDWMQPFKEPRTEIRLIKGTYYKYEVRYQYSKEKKRTEKKTVRLLGKIIPDVGFVPSDKDRIPPMFWRNLSMLKLKRLEVNSEASGIFLFSSLG